MQADQLCSIGADMTSATYLSLSIYNLFLYGYDTVQDAEQVADRGKGGDGGKTLEKICQKANPIRTFLSILGAKFAEGPNCFNSIYFSPHCFFFSLFSQEVSFLFCPKKCHLQYFKTNTGNHYV